MLRRPAGAQEVDAGAGDLVRDGCCVGPGTGAPGSGGARCVRFTESKGVEPKGVLAQALISVFGGKTLTRDSAH